MSEPLHPLEEAERILSAEALTIEAEYETARATPSLNLEDRLRRMTMELTRLNQAIHSLTDATKHAVERLMREDERLMREDD